MSEKILTSPNGMRVSVDLDTGNVTPLPRIPVTAGASGGRSPGGLATGPGSVDPDQPSEPEYGTATDASRVAADVAQPFKDIGNSALRANSAVANAIVHPVDTARAVKANPGAYAREGMRGVNDNIPFANRAVEAIGGPAAESPEDTAAAPGVRDVGNFAAAPLVGGAVGDIAGTVVRPIAQAAKARLAKRLPTDITGGATSKAAKNVIASRDILRETAQAHPDLQSAILTGDDAAKHTAISGKLDALTSANDADIDQIAAHHPEALGGRIPTAVPLSELGALAAKAEAAGDESLIEAAHKTIESVRRFEQAGTISPVQLRRVRNDLAEKIAGNATPGSKAAQAAKADAIDVKTSLNAAIEKLADETPGVDVAAHKIRNRQIASLLPAQDFLEQKAEQAAGKPPGAIPAIVNAIVHPKDTALHMAAAIPSKIDVHLAKLAGNSGPAGIAALKQVALNPTRATLQAAVQAGVAPQVALQVARLGAVQPAGAQ